MNLSALKRFAPLSTMLVFPFLGMLYALVNHPNAGREVYSLYTDMDRATPFVHYFILPYSVWIFYIYVCLIYFFIKDPKVYYRALLGYIIGTLTCYLIYSFFQTTVPRPFLTDDDFFTRLVGYIYNRDEPFNCFPSIHCFSSYLMIKCLWTSDFRSRLNQALIGGMSITIMLSTLFVKQHVIMDVVGGVLLAELILWGLLRVSRVERPEYGKVQL